jgi:glycosyltransferase involved in cell wall biosynthesis
VLLGYNDIRLVGIDLNSEFKFQDNLSNAPYSSKSPHSSDKTLESRNHHMHNAKEVGGAHNTAQGTKDKDYLGIHKLIRIFEQNCLKRIGVSLTVTNKESLMVKTGIKFQPLTEDLEIPKITFCIPSKTNLRYLKTCIPSIRENAYRKDHDIIVFVDSDEDGTVEWLKEVKDKYNIEYYVNPKLGEELYGIGMAYDFCIEKSTTDIFMIFHADMMLGKDADLKAFQHLKPKTVVCSTRVEPPIHPNAGEKILLDFGMWPEEFKKDEFNKYVEKHLEDTKTTEGIFAPWMMYKDEFIELGGHDPIMHSCREDSDVFNRMHLDGFKFIQPWSSLVYHLTGRGAGSFDGDKERHEQWQKDMNKSTMEFIRKWGSLVKHEPLMKPIVSPKYDIGFILPYNNIDLLRALEPWCSNIYCNSSLRQHYITTEQSNTSFDLSKRVLPFNNEKNNEILVTISEGFTQQDFQYIQQLSEILADSGEPAFHGELGNITVEIFETMNTYEKDLIKCEK